MAKLLTQRQTQVSDPVYPHIKRASLIGSIKFDDVYKLKVGSVNQYRQFYADLPGIVNDRHQFEKIVQRFGFKPEEYTPRIDPKVRDCNQMINDLNRLYKENPHETILTLLCYATHGMIQDGRQVVLVNQFNGKRCFYAAFGAEENMRKSA